MFGFGFQVAASAHQRPDDGLESTAAVSAASKVDELNLSQKDKKKQKKEQKKQKRRQQQEPEWVTQHSLSDIHYATAWDHVHG